jgi:hypothetical protein
MARAAGPAGRLRLKRDAAAAALESAGGGAGAAPEAAGAADGAAGGAAGGNAEEGTRSPRTPRTPRTPRASPRVEGKSKVAVKASRAGAKLETGGAKAELVARIEAAQDAAGPSNSTSASASDSIRTGTELDVDAGARTGVEAGPEAGPEAGSEAGAGAGAVAGAKSAGPRVPRKGRWMTVGDSQEQLSVAALKAACIGKNLSFCAKANKADLVALLRSKASAGADTVGKVGLQAGSEASAEAGAGSTGTLVSIPMRDELELLSVVALKAACVYESLSFRSNATKPALIALLRSAKSSGGTTPALAESELDIKANELLMAVPMTVPTTVPKTVPMTAPKTMPMTVPTMVEPKAPEPQHKKVAEMNPKAEAKSVDATSESTGADDEMTAPELKALCREGSMPLGGNEADEADGNEVAAVAADD